MLWFKFRFKDFVFFGLNWNFIFEWRVFDMGIGGEMKSLYCIVYL